MTPSPSPSNGIPLARPHSFLALTTMHLRLLFRAFPALHLLALAAVVLLPVAALLTPLGVEALAEAPSSVRTMGSAGTISLLVTVLVLVIPAGLIWPEVPWRHFPPGKRGGLDAFPVSRRLHRLARCAAGFLPLLGLYLATVLALALFRLRLDRVPVAEPQSPAALGLRILEEAPANALSVGVGLVALLLAYAIGSLVALRWGRPLLLILIVAIFLPTLIAFLALALEAGPLIEALVVVLNHPFSPFPIVVKGAAQEGAAFLPALFWTGVAGALLYREAGRHDPR